MVYHLVTFDTEFMKPLLKFLLDTLPPLLFFISYKMKGISAATSMLVVASIICLTIRWVIFKHVPMTMLIGLGVLCAFGGLTVYFDNPLFIKIKPTIVCSLFALVLAISVMLKKDLIKLMFGEALPMNQDTCKKLSLFFICVFAICAILNELIWRNFDENIWVNFKIFVLPAINLMAVGMAYVLFIRKTLTDN